MRILTIAGILALLCKPSELRSQFIAANSGNWSTGSVWSGGIAPGASANVTINANVVVTVNGNISCNDLNINGQVRLVNSLSPRSLTVDGDLVIQSAGSIVNQTSVLSLGTMAMAVRGDVINDGSFDLSTPALGVKCDLTVDGSGTQNFSGTGNNTFGTVIMNMSGSGAVFDVSSSTFNVGTNFLQLNSGLFRLSSPLNLVPFTAGTTLGANAGLATAAAGAALSTGASVVLSGTVQVSDGLIQIGNAANEHLNCNGCNIALSGGTLSAAGCFSATAGAPMIRITGGNLIVPSVSSNNTTLAPFQLSSTGAQFTMTGGTIIIRAEGGGGAQDLGYVNTGPSSPVVTGGTLQIGNSSTPVSQTISINSTVPVPALLLNSNNVSARLITNSLSVVNAITVSSGTLNSNNFAISLGGDWDNKGLFVPGTSTVIFNGNASQNLSKTGGETFRNLIFTGSGVKTFGSAVTCTGSFEIRSGSQVDVSASSHALSVAGTFMHNGPFMCRSGLVTLNGSSQQSINGSLPIDFNDLTLNNTGGAVMNNDVSFRGTLLLSNGTLNTNAKTLTLVSDAQGTGRIGTIAGSGDLTGNLTVQRFIPGPLTGWAQLGSPLNASLTFSDWDDDLTITCLSCPDGYINFPSVYRYDESAPGAFDDQAAYVPITSISDPLTQGQGYWIFVGTSLVTTNDITIDMTGPPRKFGYTVPLSYNTHSTTTHDGWNLIHNPYPSPISWSLFHNSTPGLDNAIYVYNADLGGYASYVNGVSSPATGSGGIGDAIPIAQAFFVHSTGATSLTASENVKVSSAQPLLKSLPKGALARLKMQGAGGIRDEVVVYEAQGALNAFDPMLDAYKLNAESTTAPFIGIPAGSVFCQVKAFDATFGYEIPVTVRCVASGQFTISLGKDDGAPPACLMLFDKVTGLSCDLLKQDYGFYLADSSSTPRFVLRMLPQTISVKADVARPSCLFPSSGSIVANTSGATNFIWHADTSVIRAVPAIKNSDTLIALPPGVYELYLLPFEGCASGNYSFTVPPPLEPVAAMVCTPGPVVPAGAELTLTNASKLANTHYWVIDGQPAYADMDTVTTSFAGAGVHVASLVATGDEGCSDTASCIIKVFQPSALTETKEDVFRLFSLDDGLFVVETAGLITEATVCDLNGQIVKKLAVRDNPERLEIALGDQPAAVYLARLTINGKAWAVRLVR